MNIKTQRVINWLKVSSILFAIAFTLVLVFGIVQHFVDMNAINTAGGSIWTTFSEANPDNVSDKGMAFLGAGVAGIGLLGAGVGQGYAAGKAAEAVGRNPEAEGRIRNMMIVGAAIAESSALYALVVSILLIFVV